MKKPILNQYNNQVFHFDSLVEFAREVESYDKNKIFDKGAKKQSHAHNNEYDWDFSTGFDYALEMALNGGQWARGAEQLQRAVVTAPVIMGIADSEEIELARVGACVDIGEYLNNGPECFMHFEPILHAKPVVRLLVCCSWACDFSAQRVLNRGRAILAVIEALEAQGYRVELTGVLPTSHHYTQRLNSTINPGMEIFITLKNASDTYSAQSLAYVLAHPAMFRRLGFRMMEAHNAALTNGCYGYGQSFKSFEGYDIYFAHPDNSCGFHTPEQALQQAQDIVNQFNQDKAA